MPSDFGDALRAARKAAVYSQRQAAERIGVSRKTLAGYESGSTEPKLRAFLELCRIYGINPSMANLLTK